MRSVDERVAAVRSRSRRLRRKRDGRVLAVVMCLAILPLVDLAGRTAMGGLAAPSASSGTLFGAASLFGSSIGGYVLVAVASFAVAVLVTVFLMLRRQSSSRDEDDTEGDGKAD